MILLFFILVSVSVFIGLVLKWYRMIDKYYVTGLTKYTGETCYPILGHALHIIKMTPEVYADELLRFCFKHNRNVLVTVGYVPGLITIDYNLIEYIMSSNVVTKKADPYKFMINWLGTGLLLSHGEKWRKRRKMLTPAFHLQILETYLTVFDTASNILVKELSKEITSESMPTKIDIYPFINRCTLDIICETAMGTKINAQINKDLKYNKDVEQMDRIYFKRLSSPIHYFDKTYKFTRTYRVEKRCVESLHSHTDSIIKDRRAKLIAGNASDLRNGNHEAAKGVTIDEEKTFSKGKIAFLDILLQSTVDGEPLTNEDIREEVDTFMFEGHDTTGSAISFALFSIAQYPQIQEKIIEEQNEIFANDFNRAATYTDLQNMKYLKLVIKETLRLYPSVPGIAREVTKDFEFDGVTFKQGLNIGIYVYGLHRDPKFYPEPEKFDPDRFLGNNWAKYPFSYIPFAAGSRNCIGQKFAMLEMKSTISKMVRSFHLRAMDPPHKLILLPETILKCGSGIYVKLEQRKGRRNNLTD